MLIIDFNGSRWAAQEPDTVDGLLDMLATHPLDPGFEDFGNFIHRRLYAAKQGRRAGEWVEDLKRPLYPEYPAMVRFSGNFYDYSHAFCINTDEPEVIAKLKAAIRKNQKRDDYKQARIDQGVAREKEQKRIEQRMKEPTTGHIF